MSGGRIRQILIVDDEPDNLLALNAVLKSLPDVRIVAAESGAEALSLFDENDFALAILDVQMPEMDGYELARKIREQIGKCEIPIIFLSAIYNDTLHERKGYEAGAVDFLTKPINNKILLSKIKIFLELDDYRRDLAEVARLKTSELERQHTSLRRTMDESDGIFNAIDDIILVVDENHIVLKANNAALKRYGEQIIGRESYKAILGNGELPCAKLKLSEIAEGEARHFTTPVKAVDGSLLEGAIFPIPSLSGEAREFVHILKDVTDKVEIERQLRQSEKMRALGALASGVAHDFNNQLTAIMGYANLLRKRVEGKDPKSEQYVDTILKSTRISADLTKQLLGLSHKDNGDFTLLDVHKLIEDAVALLERTIRESISIEFELRADSHMILGDSAQLNNALLNICINARDAMPKGGVLRIATNTIVIEEKIPCGDSGKLPNSNGKCIEIIVSDTGCGMDEETASRVFEPFFSTKEKGKGTGLGLASTYAAIKSHKGTIRVESRVGEGTKFVITLPVVERERSDAFVSREAPINPQGESVLLLNDDDWVGDPLLPILENLGFKVTGYGKIDTALEHLMRFRGDLSFVFIKLREPPNEVDRIVGEMRKISKNLNIVIIGETESSANDHAIYRLENSADPLEIKRLMDEITRKRR